jgi:hypothetical protein
LKVKGDGREGDGRSAVSFSKIVTTKEAASVRRRRMAIGGVILVVAVAASALLLPRSSPSGSHLVEHDGLSYLMCGDGSTGFSRQFEPGQAEVTLPREAVPIGGPWYGYPRDDSDPPVFVEVYRTVPGSRGEPVIEFASYCHDRPIAEP